MERAVVVYNGGVASWWSGLSRMSTRLVVYGGCGCAAMRMSASECSSKRPAVGCNFGLVLRCLTGVGTPRNLQGRALSAICGLIGRLMDRWERLTSPPGVEMETGGVRRLNRSSPSCLNRPAQRTNFFHGLRSPVEAFGSSEVAALCVARAARSTE